MRARQVLREEDVELELDVAPDELAVRLDGVLRTIYVLFFEGYSAHAGDIVIQRVVALGRNYTWTTGFTVPIEVRVA